MLRSAASRKQKIVITFKATRALFKNPLRITSKEDYPICLWITIYGNSKLQRRNGGLARTCARSRSKLLTSEMRVGYQSILQMIYRLDSTAHRRLYWGHRGVRVQMYGVYLAWYFL